MSAFHMISTKIEISENKFCWFHQDLNPKFPDRNPELYHHATMDAHLNEKLYCLIIKLKQNIINAKTQNMNFLGI